jgi:hypothetical protein
MINHETFVTLFNTLVTLGGLTLILAIILAWAVVAACKDNEII